MRRKSAFKCGTEDEGGASECRLAGNFGGSRGEGSPSGGGMKFRCVPDAPIEGTRRWLLLVDAMSMFRGDPRMRKNSGSRKGMGDGDLCSPVEPSNGDFSPDPCRTHAFGGKRGEGSPSGGGTKFLWVPDAPIDGTRLCWRGFGMSAFRGEPSMRKYPGSSTGTDVARGIEKLDR